MSTFTFDALKAQFENITFTHFTYSKSLNTCN